jgi:hypothetical protein
VRPFRVRSGQCGGPGGVLLASCPTALVIRRGHGAVVIAFGRELVCTRGALLERVLTVTLEHQGGGAPDVDLGYHAEKVCKPAV